MFKRLTLLALCALALVTSVDAQQIGRLRLRQRPVIVIPPSGGSGTPGTIAVTTQMFVTTTGNGVTYPSNAAVGGQAWTTVTGATTFSVPSNHLGVCVVTNSDDDTTGDGADATTGMTGAGQTTWTLGISAQNANKQQRISAYYTLGEGGVAAAISVTFPNDGDSQTGATIDCKTFSNVDTSGTNGSGAVRQLVALTAEDAGDGTLATTGTHHLSIDVQARATGSALVGFYGMRQVCTWAGTAGYTLGSEGSYGSPSVEAISTYNVGSSDQIVDVIVSACSQNRVDWVGVALEVDPTTAGADQTRPTISIRLPNRLGSDKVTSATNYGFTIDVADNSGADPTCTYTCDNCSVEPEATVSGGVCTVTGVTLGCATAPGTNNRFVFTAKDAALNEETDTHDVLCVSPDTLAPSVTSNQAASGDVTPGQITFTGRATDETAMHATEAVTVACAACAAVSSVTYNATTGDYLFTATPACSFAGTVNTIVITAKDAAGNTTVYPDITRTCTSGDSDAPTSTINCGSGNDVACTYSNFTAKTVSGVASDTGGSGLANVTASTLSGSCTFGTRAGLATWSFPVLSCTVGVNTVAVTITDGSGNRVVETIQITHTPPLQATTTACPPAQVGAAYVGCSLGASGGAGNNYTFTESGSSLGADACTGFALTDEGVTGLVDNTSAITTAGVCTFRYQVGDGSTTDQSDDISIVVTTDAPETAHQYFNTLAALPQAVAIAGCTTWDAKGCSLRYDAQLVANEAGLQSKPDAIPTMIAAFGDTSSFNYIYDAALCGGLDKSKCPDPYPDPQDGAKQISIKHQRSSDGAWVLLTNQLHFRIPDTLTTGTLFFTWDYYFTPSWRDARGGVSNVKAFKFQQNVDTAYWTLMESAGQGAQNLPSPIVTTHTDELGDGNLAQGMNWGECVSPAGEGVSYVQSIAAVKGCRYETARPHAHSKWTRYIVEIRLLQAPSAFTSWNSTYCTGSVCTGNGGTEIAQNPQDDTDGDGTLEAGEGRWHMISIWTWQEGETSPTRIIYQAPFGWNPNKKSKIGRFDFEMNSSKTGFEGPVIGYARNLMLLHNYPLTDGNNGAEDAANNPVVFKAPVRDAPSAAPVFDTDCTASTPNVCSFSETTAGDFTRRIKGLGASTEYLIASDENCSLSDGDAGVPYWASSNASGELNIDVTVTAACTVRIGGTTVSVASGANLQTAINNANPGDKLVLEEGATFTGQFTLTQETGWIQIVGAGTGATLRNTTVDNGVVITANNASYWYLKNLTITSSRTGATLIALGSSTQTLAQMPEFFVLDDINFTGDSTNGNKRGLLLNSGYAKVINSTFTDIKHLSEDACGICGWNGTGPYYIANNLIQAAAYNIMFGGSDPSISGQNPTDITITGNTLSKPTAWFSQNWRVKNIFELKSAIDVTFTNNNLNGNWGGKGDASGAAIWIKTVNQGDSGGSGCTWCVVRNVTVSGNVITNVGAGMIIHEDPGANGFFGVDASNLTVHNNSWNIDAVTWVGAGYAFLVQGMADATFSYNTITQVATEFSKVFYFASEITERPVITRNIMTDHSLGLFGDGSSEGVDALNDWTTAYSWTHNIVVTPNGSNYPQGNGNLYQSTMPASTVGYGYGQAP
jgi:hypothetical protein